MRNVREMLEINDIHAKGNYGVGVTVAVLDSGICSHPDFGNRIKIFKDFVNKRNTIYDDEGHGTHVSGIIAGNGSLSRGILKGVAPKTDIVSLKVLDNRGIGKESNVIEGIHWIIDNGKRYGIRVVNISFGTLGKDGNSNERLMQEVELLWDLGYVVVVAAGNNGPDISSITTPGDSRKVITVGASNDNVRMMINGRMKTNYSGRGPTLECIQKPDIVAPANHIISCCNLWQKKYYYVAKSGTSMSTPIVTGIISLLLSQNKDLTNVECKKIIKSTATDLKLEKNRQGWGLICPKKVMNFVGF